MFYMCKCRGATSPRSDLPTFVLVHMVHLCWYTRYICVGTRGTFALVHTVHLCWYTWHICVDTPGTFVLVHTVHLCWYTWHICVGTHGTFVLVHMAHLCWYTWHSCVGTPGTCVLVQVVLYKTGASDRDRCFCLQAATLSPRPTPKVSGNRDWVKDQKLIDALYRKRFRTATTAASENMPSRSTLDASENMPSGSTSDFRVDTDAQDLPDSLPVSRPDFSLL